MELLLLARHGHALSNARDVVSSLPPGAGLSDQGREEARALGRALRDEPVELAVASELIRTQETVALALEGRSVPVLILPEWNEIGFGAFEGGPLEAYRGWAWAEPADAVCPGGGETRGAVALRVAGVLDAIAERREGTILAVGHALPVRYVLDAAEGRTPRPRIEPVAHGVAHALTLDEVGRAASVLRSWGVAPLFPYPQA